MATVSAYYVTGLTVKAVVRDDSLEFADVVAEAMESYNAGSITDYDIACTEIGNTGEYHATWPTWLTVGLYTIQFMPLAAGTIAETDFPNRFAVQSYYWDGTNLIPDWAFKIAGVASPVANSGEAVLTDWINGGRLDLILDNVSGGGATNITTETTTIESED